MRQDAPPPSEETAETFNFPPHGFTCFHCGDTFHSVKAAREHFGETPDEQPGCVLKLSQGEKGLLAVVRSQYFELRRYREEDQPIVREIYTLGAEHARALRDAEQLGYDRGRAEARLPEVGAVGSGVEDRPPPQSRSKGPLRPASRETGPPATLQSGKIVRPARTHDLPTAPTPIPDPPAPFVPAARIDLTKAPSAMDARAQAVREAASLPPPPAPAEPADLVPCRCGAKGIHGYGQVPRWFGKDCIEAQCPLRKAA